MKKNEIYAELGEEAWRPGHKWEYNTKLHLKVIGEKGVEWIDLLRKGKVVESCKNGNEPSGPINCDKFLDYLRKYQLLNKDTSVALGSHLRIILPNSHFA
jgi:hypothetical protein